MHRKLWSSVLVLTLVLCALGFAQGVLPQDDLLKTVIVVPDSPSSLKVDLWWEVPTQRVFSPGDRSPVIHATPSEDGHLMIIHVNSKGQMLLLWPDAFDDPQLKSEVRARQQVTIPSLYRFVGDYSGMEFFQVFFFRTMNPELQSIIREMGSQALDGTYTQYSLFDQFNRMKNLVRVQQEADWTSNTLSFHYNTRPSMKEVELIIGGDLQLPYFVDGLRVDKRNESLTLSRGQHILHYYKGNQRFQEIFQVGDATRQRITIPQEPLPARIERKVVILSVGVSNHRMASLNLSTPAKDAQAFEKGLESALRAKGVTTRSRVLVNEQATRAGILQGLDWLKRESDQTTEAIFYFSGHGTQIPDESGDEEDGMDECLVPYDYDETTQSLIIDDDLAIIFKDIASKAKTLLVVIDSCFSGDMHKTAGFMEQKGIVFPGAIKSLGPPPNQDFFMSEMKGIRDNFIFMAASQGDEIAWADPARNLGLSLYTYHLLKVLREAPNIEIATQKTHDRVVSETQRYMEQHNLRQRPTPFYENRSDREFYFPRIQ